MTGLRCCMIVLTLLLVSQTVCRAGIIQTRHNLKAGEAGDLFDPAQEQICIFCHVPHHATDQQPLWSRNLSSATYTPYDSSTMDASPGQPTGNSRLCLSCHDGTIALGMLAGGRQIANLGPIPAGRPSYLGTDLSDDHPISFAYTTELAQADGELVDPAILPLQVRLEHGLFLQCRTCHDPHDDTYPKFLVMANDRSALCVTCHDKTNWTLSTHATDSAVAVDGCGSCHRPHNAQGQNLMNQIEENDCLVCHDSAGPGMNVATVFNKFYRHPIADPSMSGIHEANEDLQTMQRHVECADCHNGHQLNGDSGAPPLVMGATRGVTGIDLSGFDVTPAPYQYQVCLKCHADNNALFQTAVPRQIDEVNLRYRFDSINPSFHPVAAAGKNASVPGLLGMSESSYIYCTDCHGNADSVMAGGSEANGPHGSKYDHQLLYRYEQDSYPQTYSTLFYALCYSCHSETVLFDEAQTNFPSHQRHVRGRGTPCSICHDPHGVSSMGGATVTGNAHLINFDARFVDPASAVYNSVTKSCTVSCHSKNPRSY